MPTHDNEQLLNGALADLLRDSGLQAAAEQRVGKKRIDVIVQLDGVAVMLEAETNNQKQALKEAEGRLKDGLTSIVFAINYASGQTVAALDGARLDWSLRTDAALQLGQTAVWSSGSLTELANAIRQAPRALDVDDAARMLSEALDTAVGGLSTPTRQALAQALDLPSVGGRGDGWFTPAKRGLLVVVTAMLFHHRLQQHLQQLERPDGWSGDWPPPSATDCAEPQTNAISAQLDAWAAILAVDYRPVFEAARAALMALPMDEQTQTIVSQLARAARDLSPRTQGLRHDLLGRIFHRVLDTARYDGSFYTSTAAAVLLAGLAIREGDCDWSDPDAIARLRICDPACGTGTLLMAAAERIRDLRLDAVGQLSEDEETLLAQSMVEDVLWGYDINVTATHMAATTLGMLSPKTQFDRMRVYRTLLGVEAGQAYIGSLEFLDRQPKLMPLGGSTSVAQVDDQAEGERPAAMDLVIMNPPFTRDSLRHDQFDPADELQLKQREQLIQSGLDNAAAGRRHSLGGMFTILSDRLLKANGGILALILPSVVPTAPGNLALRQWLASKFHVDTVVSSHDPQRINMSENTSIGEVLIVCRRWASDAAKPPTRFINLARNPANASEALELLNQLKRDARETYTVQEIEAERIAEGDWYATNFYSPLLVEEYRAIAKGNLKTINDQRSTINDQRSTINDPSCRCRLWRRWVRPAKVYEAHSPSPCNPPKRGIARCGARTPRSTVLYK